MKEIVKIGTRGSPLALIQANMVRDGLIAAYPGLIVEITIIRTSGDRIQDRTLAEAGGKGLFTKEIEEAMLDGGIDIAVHSMKDVETWLPDGLVIETILPREDPRDAFLTRNNETLAELQPGAVVGTSSLRRQAQILAARPDVSVQPLRGNVETRKRKLADGDCDATILAVAGLVRLGMNEDARRVMDMDVMLPAVAQGAVGVEHRENDTDMGDMLSSLHDHETATCVAAERAMLAALDGSCRTPIAGLATLAGSELQLTGLVASPDGKTVYRETHNGKAADAKEIGTALGNRLKDMAGPNFFPR